MKNKKKNKKQRVQAIFFFIVMVAVSSLAFHDQSYAESEDQTVIMRLSAALVNTTATGVDKSIRLLIGDQKIAGEALARFKHENPEHNQLSALLDKKLESCPPIPQVELYCMSYDYRTKDMHTASLQNAAMLINDRSASHTLKGCYQKKTRTMRLCLFEPNRTKRAKTQGL
jgi:hypothetical protein